MRWRRNRRVLWRAAPGYLALAAVDGRTTEVAGTGCEVWARLELWVEEEELVGSLARDFGADERVVSGDVRSLLGALHAEGFVDRDD